MVYLRSALFQVTFYLAFIVQMIIFTPFYFLLPRKIAYHIAKFWCRGNLFMADKIAGISYEIQGLENLPKGGCIISAKHQSFWDTFAIVPTFDDPVFILKRELIWIPLFGWYLAKQRMIAIDRSAKARAIPKMIEQANEAMAESRQLIIYPEGTRKVPGDKPDYKYGIAKLYTDLNVPVVPVIQHAGLFWPRKSFLRRAGHIVIRILPPIQPGMNAREFFLHLADYTERESDRLLVETVAANPQVPLTEITKKRLAELKGPQPSA